MFEERLNRTLNRIWAWSRWQLGLMTGSSHRGEGSGVQPSFGTGTLVLAAFVYQVVSGGLLLLYYQPSVYPTLTLCGQAPGTLSASPAAWCSTYYIVHSAPMGAVLLTSHLYGAYVVIFLLLVHLFRGYYVGAYRQPGGASSWVLGVLLLLLTLGMGFTGYLLVYTQLSYDATEVSVTLVRALPWAGPALANLVTGDGTPQSLLTRMFDAHVVLIPAAVAVLIFLHKRTALFPHVVLGLVKWGLLYVGVLLGVASLWLWPLPTYAGNSTGGQGVTVPAWYFLWVFKLVDFVGVTPAEAMLVVALIVLFLVILPFVDRSRRSDLRERPVFLFLGNSLVGFFILMTVWGGLAPGVPIPPAEVVLRLGPVLAVNALAVFLFYGRFRRTAARRELAQAPDSSREPGAPSEGPRTTRASRRMIPLATYFTVAGLAAALFLLAFGLVVPFLFVFAAFLVELAATNRIGATAAGPPPSAQPNLRWFPVIAFCATVFLLLALILTVAF